MLSALIHLVCLFCGSLVICHHCILKVNIDFHYLLSFIISLSTTTMSAAAAQDASSTAALVAYLRCEADIAELKAKRLRQQADALAQEHGDPIFTIYSPEEMAPLDEFGVPKYKGKKRGRKPKPRQRHHNPNRKKRSHTAYTLFVQENHPVVKAQYPDLQSKDIIAMVARQWATVSATEKAAWKQRAIASAIVEDEGLEDGNEEEDTEEDDEEEEEEEEESEPKKKRGRSKKK